MCGIAAMVGLGGRPADPAAIERMMSSLVHRGPDGEGIHILGSVGLGFRRLAILDPSPAAHQPMVSQDGRHSLVFNGEIFNYIELRDELRSLGYTFTSSGDTEVLLHAYRHWGAECLPRLNGMWAFLIYDRERRTVFGSRDRFGIKPLYFYHSEQYVLFASEIKAIRISDLYACEVNWHIAARFLLESRLDEGYESFYAGISQVPPGTAFELDLEGRLRQWRYWSMEQISHIEVTNPVEAFREVFDDSVRLRMRSDVPVGVCLSGGLDSSSIACAAARLKSSSKSQADEPLRAFSFMSPEYDESAFIEDTVRQAHAQLNRLETDPLQLWNTISRVLWFHDEPVHSMTALVGFELMRLAASKGIRVVLNGQGADETLAGYFIFFPEYWETLLGMGKVTEAWRQTRSYAATHGANQWNLLLSASVRMLCRKLHHIGPYHDLARWRHHRRIRNNPWYTRELSRSLQPEELDGMDGSLDAVLRQAVGNFPLPLYLRIEDRNSMAHSVEARLPFLDYRLVSLIFNLPAQWKLRGPWNKFLLREAMRSQIPESVRTRSDKMGFPVPAKHWFTDVLYEPMRDILTSQKVKDRGIYNVGAIVTDLEKHRKGTINVAGKLFHVAQFELWARMLNGDA